MCNFFSGIVTKDKTYAGWETDSHEDLIKAAKLDDTTNNPNFVRVEFVPKDGDIFNHNSDNWVLKVDQDFKPEWFTEKFAKSEMRKNLENFVKERFIVDREVDEIKTGRWFLKNGIIRKLCGDAKVGEMRETSQVGVMMGTSQVGVMWETSQVGVYNKNVEYKTIKENGMAILYYKDNPEIIVANKNIKVVVREE